MFGLVFSAFPKPPNTADIQTEVLPAPPSPSLPLLRRRGSASSSLLVTSSRLKNVAPPHPTSHQRWARGHGALKELTASGPRESSYLQVSEIKTRIYLE